MGSNHRHAAEDAAGSWSQDRSGLHRAAAAVV